MPNPTRQEIIDAYTAVTTLARLAEEFTHVRVEEHKEINDLHLAVRAALPPRPQPTMDKIAWDDDKHYLAEVENRIWGRGVMLYLDGERDTILCQFQQEGEPYTLQCELDTLTPTGRRYTLTEVQE